MLKGASSTTTSICIAFFLAAFGYINSFILIRTDGVCLYISANMPWADWGPVVERPFFHSLEEPSYIEKYDQILSISQDAINRQLLHLYNTPVPMKGLPPPTSGPQPLREYLISRTLNMSIPENSSSGKIAGKIACPTVSWDNLKASDNRTVRMTIKFLAGSTFRYYVVDLAKDPPSVKEENFDIVDYTFSFEASLGQKDIRHIQESEFLLC
jgi:hypothetical protein